MDDVFLRLSALIRTLIPFVFFMASVYIAVHTVVARLVQRPDSQVLWFFAVVTGPLTRPVRRLLPADTAEPRVRLISLAFYVALWLASGAFVRWLGALGSG